MPPKPCPTRLRRLIAEANENPSDTAHPLRLILRAIEAKRQNKGPNTLPLQSMSVVTVNLTDYSITVRNELDLALKEIDPPANINLIRECRSCPRLFWAGRVDKVVCDKHAEQWRKSKQRNKKKDAQKEAAEQKIREGLKRMSRTATATLNAIVIGNQRVFWKIDNDVYFSLKGKMQRVPNWHVVRETLQMLVRRGHLRHQPHLDPFDDWYMPEPELINRWTEIQKEREQNDPSQQS